MQKIKKLQSVVPERNSGQTDKRTHKRKAFRYETFKGPKYKYSNKYLGNSLNELNSISTGTFAIRLLMLALNTLVDFCRYFENCFLL